MRPGKLLFATTLAAALAAQSPQPRRPLTALAESLAARRTQALLILRDGRIALEWYAPGRGPADRHYTASLAKAIVGGLSLMLALGDGRLGVDDPASRYIPSWRGDSRKSAITIRHLATHSSGIEDAEENGKPHAALTGWKGAFWKRTPDPFSIALAQAPVLFEPGARYAYSNPGMAALAYAVTASLRGAPQADLRGLIKERVMDPLGVPESEWSIGYGQAYELDGLRLYVNWGGGFYTARAVARVGQLLIEGGAWGGRQLIPRARVEQALAPAGAPLPDRSGGEPAPASGLCWYTNRDRVWPSLPSDAVAGAGAGHQLLLVSPSLRLVAVRQGEALEQPAGRAGFWKAVDTHFFRPLAAALAEAGPYPPSAVIGQVSFEPLVSVRRAAIGSDNWPLTWADDGSMYTSYGDGWGFEPRIDRKLSLGFARITGPAEKFRAENIRSESGERAGDGPRGPKASGMLMVDGVLYMWVRNMDTARLAWSGDRGRTWQWGFGWTESFGSPAFVNFGANYAGARDDYVYTFSQDGPSAYASEDSLLLARVHRTRLRERDSYEFFQRLENGRPVWTREIGARGAVFRFPGHCQRVDAVYNPGLRRYLLALGYDHQGGWGLYDAPEPWGPWTTAFHTMRWDSGKTHGYRLPSRWISADGETMHLVYSGVTEPGLENDAFCVRRMRLFTRPAPRARR